MHTVISANVLVHGFVDGGVTVPNTYSILAIRTRWADGVSADNDTAIQTNLDKAKQVIATASYNTCLPTSALVNVNTGLNWAIAVKDCSKRRVYVRAKTSKAGQYTPRMIYLPIQQRP